MNEGTSHFEVGFRAALKCLAKKLSKDHCGIRYLGNLPLEAVLEEIESQKVEPLIEFLEKAIKVERRGNTNDQH